MHTLPSSTDVTPSRAQYVAADDAAKADASHVGSSVADAISPDVVAGPQVTVDGAARSGRTATANSTTRAEQNRATLERTYAAFARHDPETMVAAYADKATFEDPVFGKLSADDTRKMWRGLASGKSLKLTYDVEATPEGGTVRWKADYVLNGHAIHNEVTSHLVMNDGKIVQQRDDFDFARWAAQASPGVIGTMAQHVATRWLAQQIVRANARHKVGISII